MKRRSLFALLGLGLALPSLARAVQNARATVIQNTVRYLTFLPTSYRETGPGVPLIIFLHGSGERGNDLNKVKAWGPPAIVDSKPYFPFMVVSPQCPEGETWDALLLKGLIDEVLAKYRVDKRRVYLTGISMGGYGAWDLACRYPRYFAAVAPICGGGNPRAAAAMKDIPTWVFHGAKDDAVPESESAAMVAAMEAAGAEVKYTVLPDGGHIDAWVYAYGEAKLFDWFLEQRKPA